MKVNIGEVQPTFANTAAVATGSGVIRITFGESYDDKNHWHTAVYLPSEVAKALSDMLSQSVQVRAEHLTEQ